MTTHRSLQFLIRSRRLPAQGQPLPLPAIGIALDPESDQVAATDYH